MTLRSCALLALGALFCIGVPACPRTGETNRRPEPEVTAESHPEPIGVGSTPAEAQPAPATQGDSAPDAPGKVLPPTPAPPPTNRAATEPSSKAKGTVIEQHWPNGGLRSREHVRREPDGSTVLHGVYTRWHPNGQKEYEAYFEDGKKHGIATTWHRNGSKWIEEHYDHGRRHGPRYVWDETGAKRKEEQHYEGRPHGTWTVWTADGRLKWRGHFEHGQPVDPKPSNAPGVTP